MTEHEKSTSATPDTHDGAQHAFIALLGRGERYGVGVVRADAALRDLPPAARPQPECVMAETGTSRQELLTEAIRRLLGNSAVQTELYCTESDVLAAVSELRPSWPYLAPRKRKLGEHHWLRKHALGHADRLLTKDVGPLCIAVDGSWGRHSDVAGWAWMRSDGAWGSGTAPAASPLVSELLAVWHAVMAHPGHPVRMLVDSREALAVARHGARPGTHPQAAALGDRIRAHVAQHPVSFGWVAGHSGNPLNEAAHRLAVAARRNHEARTPHETAARMTDGIVEDAVEALRGRSPMPRSRRVNA